MSAWIPPQNSMELQHVLVLVLSYPLKEKTRSANEYRYSMENLKQQEQQLKAFGIVNLCVVSY